MFKHQLGVEAKSRTMGLKGIIMGRAEHLYGCNRYLIQAPIGKDGKVGELWWTDEDDIEVIGKGVRTDGYRVEKKNTGGIASKLF